MTDTMTETAKPNEIAIIRMYDAPVQLVWDAWTDPQQAAQWWGPRGFTITTHSKDLRPGGIWHYTMHGPDGVDYPNKAKYLEVETNSRLVYDHGGNDEQAPLFRVTVVFTDVDGKTKMDMRMALPTAQAAEDAKVFIKKAGGNATWDRLAEFLVKESLGKEIFVINRSFDAPIDELFNMWTDPQHFSQWLPPTGFTMSFIKPDIRVGGNSFYSMTDGKNITMYGRIEYLAIERPRRIEYTQQFADKGGNVSRHPLAPIWPETMLTNVLLTEEGPDKTRVTVTWSVYGTATQEEIDAFIAEKGGMTRGWTGSFDKLDAYLAHSPSHAA